MKLVDVKLSTLFYSSNKINDKDPKFEIGDIARISKYETIFTKGYVSNWSEEVLLLVILKAKKLLERFTKKNCKKQVKKSLELKQ